VRAGEGEMRNTATYVNVSRSRAVSDTNGRGSTPPAAAAIILEFWTL